MCLVTDWKEPKIAEKDIVCYKWYEKGRNNTYESPYQGSPIPTFKTVIHTELDTPEIFNDAEGECYMYKRILDKDLIYKIHKGFHSFSTYEGVRSDITSCLSDVIIVSCIIPKGSRYYRGVFGGKESYCSEAITIEEIIQLFKR